MDKKILYGDNILGITVEEKDSGITISADMKIS